MRKITARQLTDILLETSGSTRSLEDRLNAQSDEQLRGLIEMCEKIIRERASSTK